MATHHLRLPLSETAVRALSVGDLVLLEGEIVITAGLPTFERMLACTKNGDPLPTDLHGAALFHLGSYSQGSGKKFEILYMNPTTSTRFNGYMPYFIRTFGLRAVGGKGGLDMESTRAMQEVGCVYLSFLGGGAALHTDAIQEVVSVGWDDLIAHYRLVRLRVAGLGPLTVAIDAHGNNVYENLKQEAARRLPELLAGLERDRKG